MYFEVSFRNLIISYKLYDFDVPKLTQWIPGCSVLTNEPLNPPIVSTFLNLDIIQ